MRQAKLSVKAREAGGKGAARKLRREGIVPAVYYGKKTGTLNIEVNNKELKNILSSETGSSTLLNLKFEGETGGDKLAMIKEIQSNPVTDKLIHIDFLEIREDEKMSVPIPVNLVGKSVGVELGGALQPIRRELDVYCLPKDLPESIEIDISNLDLGQSIHIDDIELPKGVEVPHDVNFTIAVVLAKRGAAEEEAAEGEAEEAVEGEAAEASE